MNNAEHSRPNNIEQKPENLINPAHDSSNNISSDIFDGVGFVSLYDTETKIDKLCDNKPDRILQKHGVKNAENKYISFAKRIDADRVLIYTNPDFVCYQIRDIGHIKLVCNGPNKRPYKIYITRVGVSGYQTDDIYEITYLGDSFLKLCGM